jgi:hypothetical protein
LACVRIENRHIISFFALAADATTYSETPCVTATKAITYSNRGFWAYDVAAGVFLKHLIDAALASREANTPWLSEAVSSWRVQAVITEFGFTLEENWSAEQRKTFIALAEEACTTLATRDIIPAEEIASWPLADDMRIYPRGAVEVATAPVVELGRAIIALVRGELPEPPKGEAWFFGIPTGRSTIRMDRSWDGRW